VIEVEHGTEYTAGRCLLPASVSVAGDPLIATHGTTPAFGLVARPGRHPRMVMAVRGDAAWQAAPGRGFHPAGGPVAGLLASGRAMSAVVAKPTDMHHRAQGDGKSRPCGARSDFRMSSSKAGYRC
jgi:hypothetical protein